MLLEAKRAGDALLAAKAKVKHGEFKAWVEANCRCSYETANRYRRVAQLAASKNVTLDTFEGGLIAFLEAHAKPRAPEPVQFDIEDAERALRINDRIERGDGAERAVAASKLETVAGCPKPWANHSSNLRRPTETAPDARSAEISADPSECSEREDAL